MRAATSKATLFGFVAAAIVVLVAFPYVAAPYYVTLVLPAFAYAIALLGFNLLFGTTGLLSFGHALFVAIGAYVAAVMTSKLGVKSFELILVVAPVIVGAGRRLLPDGGAPLGLRPAGTETTPAGLVVQRYEPTGPAQFGTYG